MTTFRRILAKFTSDRSFRPPAAMRLVFGLAGMVAVGTLLLLLPGMTTRSITFMDAMFTATSAVTVTGLTVLNTSADFTFLGQSVLLALIQIGGLGFIVLFALTLRLLGRNISLLDRLALSAELGVDKSGSVWVLLRRTIIIMLVVETVGAVLLYAHWRINDIVAADQAVFYAIFHSITAFCNAGFDLFAGHPRYPHGLPDDPISLIILGVLVIAGGLGIPVYLDLLFRRGLRMTLHTRVTLATSVFLILLGMIGLILGEFYSGALLRNETPVERLVTAWFQSVSARTAGFPGLESFELLHQSSRLLLIGLMFVGSGPASMGGGITTGTFAVLGLSVASYIRGHRRTRLVKRTISDDTVRRAVAVLVITVAFVGMATWLLLLSHPFTLDTALFEIVSAISTCGLTLGITDDLTTFGRFVVMATMFWGRLGAMTIMIALLQRRSSSRLISYPEATLLVG